MPKKLVDILKVLNDQINSSDLNGALQATEPFSVEIEDDKFSDIESQTKSLMSLEKAVNSPNVIEKLRPNIESELKKTFKSDSLFAVEKQLEEFGNKIGIDLDKKKQHGEQLRILLDNAEGLKGQTVDTTKFTEEIKTLHDQLKERDNLLEETKTNFKNEMESFKVESSLRNKLASYTLQDAYTKDKVRDGLINSIIGEVNSQATLKLGQNGDLEVFQKDNPEMKLFGDNNKEIGINDLLDSKIKDYIKVSDGGGKTTPAPSPTSTSEQVDKTGSAAGTMQNLRASGDKLA